MALNKKNTGEGSISALARLVVAYLPLWVLNGLLVTNSTLLPYLHPFENEMQPYTITQQHK